MENVLLNCAGDKVLLNCAGDKVLIGCIVTPVCACTDLSGRRVRLAFDYSSYAPCTDCIPSPFDPNVSWRTALNGFDPNVTVEMDIPALVDGATFVETTVSTGVVSLTTYTDGICSNGSSVLCDVKVGYEYSESGASICQAWMAVYETGTSTYLGYFSWHDQWQQCPSNTASGCIADNIFYVPFYSGGILQVTDLGPV